MIVECPACTTIFPVDPKKVPAGGIHARCSVCSEVFFVSVPEPEADLTEPGSLGSQEEGAFEEDEATLPQPADTAVEDSEAGSDEEVESVVEESEPDFEEVESVVEEPEPDFEEVESVVEESEPDFEEAAATFEEATEAVEETATAQVMDAVEEVAEPPSETAPLFGKRDPTEKAQRLARVLVSDIILYNPDRHHTATESGRVKEEFGEEIQKSWNEYVEQVGEDLANSTNFFNDALNEILAKGEQIF